MGPRGPGRSHRRVGPQVGGSRGGDGLWLRTWTGAATSRRSALAGVRRGGVLAPSRAEAPRESPAASAEATRERQNTSRPKVPCILGS